jgi:hypothetical protein
MKITTLFLGITIGVAMLLGTAPLASEFSIASEGTPTQQDDMKSDGQMTILDMQPGLTGGSEPSQESTQSSPDSKVQTEEGQAQAEQGQPAPSGDQPSN